MRLVRLKFLCRFVRKGNDFARVVVQPLPRLREQDGAVVLAADKKPRAQLVLQVHNLPRERRLRNVNRLRRLRDALLPRHRKKIPQNAKFHAASSELEKSDAADKCLPGIFYYKNWQWNRM